MLTARLEEYWLSLRIKKVKIPAAHLLTDSGHNAQSDLPDIRMALNEYLRLKGEGKDKYFYSFFMCLLVISSLAAPILTANRISILIWFIISITFAKISKPLNS